MLVEWDVLLQTENNNRFTLGVFAHTETEAKSKARKFGQDCKILGVRTSRREAHNSLKGVNTLPVL